MKIYLWGTLSVSVAAALAAWQWNIAPVGIAALAGGAYWIVIISLCVVIGYWRQRWQAKHIFAQQRDLHGETTVEWSAESVSFRSARGSSTFAWSDFSSIVKGQDMILLRQSDALMNFVPTRVLSPEQILSFPDARA
ncbi:hypothetical protein GRI97_13625 [Altererythrobacter xixiisoli]|uniref:YcxB-like C-terminal domain-containing protein n=1 Tax=Croceibacterium xixiisoli TaxID=1476466 RepID=A0A6I4TZH7_9SPHN|nr:hypothetical protein [Croceibacterium xixiisoli]